MSDDHSRLLAYARPGFEGDLAAEIMDRTARVDVAGFCRTEPGLVEFEAVTGDASTAWREMEWRTLVFARQWLLLVNEVEGLPEDDRAGPLAASVVDRLTAASDLFLEYPDTNDGKGLSRFCRRFRGPLQRRLLDAGVRLDADGSPRLHVLFTDSRHARIAISAPENSAPWPLGIPRLRMPGGAPSRSTLKLDEAIRTFLGSEDEERWFRAGMTAVDLGAAPGGWSWQLARRGLRVTAVDNGPMDTALLDGGLVEHVRADGFRFRPRGTVDWLVCDIVEQPHRIARLMADRLRRGDCRGAIFNLKLPMKRRYIAVCQALEAVREAVDDEHRIACKQLYHDREEVTVCVRPATA